MPQGKMKVKTKLPKSVKKKNVGPPAAARKNKPVIGKVDKTIKQKINKQITKNVNAALEAQIRDVANDAKKVFLSKKKNKSNTGTSKK